MPFHVFLSNFISFWVAFLGFFEAVDYVEGSRVNCVLIMRLKADEEDLLQGELKPEEGSEGLVILFSISHYIYVTRRGVARQHSCKIRSATARVDR